MPYCVIGKSQPNPIEIKSIQKPFAEYAFTHNDSWKKVTIDLEKAGIEPGKLIGINLSAPPSSKYLERLQYGKTEISFKNWQSESTTDVTQVASSHKPTSLSKVALLEGKLSKQDKKLLTKSLNQKNEKIQLNACAALTRCKMPSSIAILKKRAQGASASIAMMACKALAFQDTEESQKALHNTIEIGPFEHNRQAALKHTLISPKPEDTSMIRKLMTSDRWQTRLLAVQALGRIHNQGSALMLMAFLFESDPCVRNQVILNQDTKYEIVNRRLMWYSVNDPSEEIRINSYIKLIQSPLAEYQKEGYKGIRDESIWVRAQLLDYMKKNPSDNHRNAIRLAVTDVNAFVRSKALEAFASMDGSVEIAEFENTLADKDPRIQKTLLRLANKKNLSLPEKSLSQLKESASNKVKRLVGDSKS